MPWEIESVISHLLCTRGNIRRPSTRQCRIPITSSHVVNNRSSKHWYKIYGVARYSAFYICALLAIINPSTRGIFLSKTKTENEYQLPYMYNIPASFLS